VDIFSTLSEIESTSARLVKLKAEAGASLTESQQALAHRCQELAALLERTGAMPPAVPIVMPNAGSSSFSLSFG